MAPVPVPVLVSGLDLSLGWAPAVAAGLAATATWWAFPRRPTAIDGPTRRVPAAVAVAVVLALLAGVVRPSGEAWAMTLLLAGVVVGATVLRRQQRARRQAASVGARVQGFCEELAGALSAGLPVPTALAGAVDQWPELEGAATTQRLGGSVPDALRLLAERRGAGDLRLVAAAWQVAHRSGASLAAALDTVAETVRERQRTRRLVASELASARATARLMAVLPVFTLVLGSGSGGDPVGFLLTTLPGLACLGLGLLLAFLGLWWIEGIAGAIEREVR